MDIRSALSKVKFVYVYSLVGLRSLCKGLASRVCRVDTKCLGVSGAAHKKWFSTHPQAHRAYVSTSLPSKPRGLLGGAEGAEKDRGGGGDCHPLCLADDGADQEETEHWGGMVLQVQVNLRLIDSSLQTLWIPGAQDAQMSQSLELISLPWSVLIATRASFCRKLQMKVLFDQLLIADIWWNTV